MVSLSLIRCCFRAPGILLPRGPVLWFLKNLPILILKIKESRRGIVFVFQCYGIGFVQKGSQIVVSDRRTLQTYEEFIIVLPGDGAVSSRSGKVSRNAL